VTIIHPDTGEKVDIDAQLYYEANRKFSKLVDYFEDDPYMRTIQEGNILRDLIEQSNRLLSQPQPAPPVDQPPVSPNQAEEPEERMSTLLERDNRQPKQRVTPPDNKTKKPAKPKGGIDNLINEDFIE